MGAILCECNSTYTLLDLWNTFFYFFDHFCWFTIDARRELKMFFFSIHMNYNLSFLYCLLELLLIFFDRENKNTIILQTVTVCKTLFLRINWLIKFVISFSNTSVFNLSDCLELCFSNFCYTTRDQVKYIKKIGKNMDLYTNQGQKLY